MGNQPDQPWNPYDLFTDEHNALLESSSQIEAAQAHVRELAHSLAADGLLAVPDVQWLVHMAYCALAEVKAQVWLDEHRARVRQIASQIAAESQDSPIDLPAYEPVDLPAWLLAVDQQEGG
jgi:hypothetical protein